MIVHCASRVRSRRDEHRQHVDSRSDDRLRPYGWLEDYNPGWTPNTTDREYKRYRFGAQPHIGQWNCTQLANAIYPLVGEVEPLQEALETYVDVFNTDWRRMMGAKLGIAELDGERDSELIHDLLELLPKIETDMTLFFRGLANVSTTTVSTLTLRPLLGPITTRTPSPASARRDRRLARSLHRPSPRGRSCRRHRASDERRQPAVRLRNYVAQLAIDEADTATIADPRAA